MRVKPNEIINSYAGKLGKNIFSAVKGSSAGTIQTLKKFTKPYNPNTPAQQLIRNTFKYALNVFYNAEDKIIGSTTFDKQTFLDDLNLISKNQNYRGIATTGQNAGSQLFAGSFVLLKEDSDIATIVLNNKLPQEMILETDLIQFNTATNKAFDTIRTMIQKDRIGFVDNN